MNNKRALSISGDFDPYHKWLGIPKDKRPPTYYQLLGISPSEEDRDTIDSAAERQSGFVMQFRGTEYDELAAKILFEIEDARVTLLDEEGRRRYDATLNMKHRRQRKRVTTVLPVAEGRVVGEETGILGQYAGIVAILCVAFFGMAAASFWLPWGKDAESNHDADPVVLAELNAEQPVRNDKPAHVVNEPPIESGPPAAKPKENDGAGVAETNDGAASANEAKDSPITFTSLQMTIGEDGDSELVLDSRNVEEAHKVTDEFSGEKIKLKSLGDAQVTRLGDRRLRMVYDFSEFSDVGQLFPTFLNDNARKNLGELVRIDQSDDVLVLTPNEMKRVELPLPRMIRPPFTVRADLLGHSEGMFQLTVRPGNALLVTSIHGKGTPDSEAEVGSVSVSTRPAPNQDFESLLGVKHGASENNKYTFKVDADIFQRNAMLSIAYFGDLPIAISRIEVIAKVPPSFGIAFEQRGNRIVAKQVVSESAASDAGVRQGDVLLGINGSPISDLSGTLDALANCELGKETVLKILRFGSEREIKVIPK